MNTTDAIERVKEVFDRETHGMSTSDYIDVCSELADEFQVRADAAQEDLDKEDGE